MQLRFKISIINVLITLDNKTLENIKKQCEFVSNMRVFKISLNRLEIYIQFNLIKYTKKHIKNLQHMLLTQVKKSQDISKIVVYIDKIIDVNKIYKRI